MCVELKHGMLWGKRVVKVNGKERIRERQLVDEGSRYEIEMEMMEVSVVIKTMKWGFEYELLVNGETVTVSA